VVRFVPIRAADPSQVVTTVTQLLAAREAAQGGTGGPAATGVSLVADDRGGRCWSPPRRNACPRCWS
jgi:hypothetical protein